ncbi:YihY/virulence factor BrkB family protein [Leeuwenhoekiella polynyae]|uniref:Membrane protein n=1 Tax=Leeuwenhoekiella polynyae TaxID=1550906 RepID=A0A4Q0P3L6_9FLAO|nr:YihY/virulence factor BrkB family protein [Leeuwenhoekiella polynyae]RXG20905.1 membrane protein [Leeuwenhoekiella polynyae]
MNKPKNPILKKGFEFFIFMKNTYLAWDRNDPFAKSAIIAYYTLFSLPSLLMIVTSIASTFVGTKAVQGRIHDEIARFISPQVAVSIEEMIGNVTLQDDNWITLIISIAALIYGATGVFFQMKKTMNTIWNVTEKNQNFKRMLINRAIAFGMVLVLGFMLLVAFVVTVLLNLLTDYLAQFAPVITVIFADALRFLISFIFIASLFAAIFKILPDVKMGYKTTVLGASITAILFLIGESLLGYYFSSSNPASVYGGAASIVLMLLWVNYTCLILFFGAEITVQYALVKKHKIVPSKHAEFAHTEETKALREKQKQLDADKKKAIELATNPEDPKNPTS